MGAGEYRSQGSTYAHGFHRETERSPHKFYCFSLSAFCSTALLASGPWQVLGPDGGDARSLAYDAHNPDHILLGTSTGQMFASNDAGRTWSRLARLGGDDYVLDHISIDPQDSNRIYVSAWSVSSQQIGEVFRTRDGGRNWDTLPAMHGKSIRALAMHKGDSKVVVVGALDGVYRSKDGGDTWERLSPANSAEIKNIESIAVDPKDPNTVYAGTWHLAWKTSDGGANWQHINKGMIDDSDVFSVIVDHDNPSVVFASACSGIYQQRERGQPVLQDSRHPVFGAPHPRTQAGSDKRKYHLRRNHRRPLEIDRSRQGLEAREQSRSRRQ